MISNAIIKTLKRWNLEEPTLCLKKRTISKLVCFWDTVYVR